MLVCFWELLDFEKGYHKSQGQTSVCKCNAMVCKNYSNTYLFLFVLQMQKCCDKYKGFLRWWVFVRFPRLLVVYLSDIVVSSPACFCRFCRDNLYTVKHTLHGTIQVKLDRPTAFLSSVILGPVTKFAILKTE